MRKLKLGHSSSLIHTSGKVAFGELMNQLNSSKISPTDSARYLPNIAMQADARQSCARLIAGR